MSKRMTPGRTHGKISTYQAGCRCPLCKDMGAERSRLQRYRNGAQVQSLVERDHDDSIDALIEVLHGI